MPIETDEATIDTLFSANSIFRMPMFQRRFEWTTTRGTSQNGARFWSDLDELLEEQVEKSFLGAIVVKNVYFGPLRPSIVEVIDGQQRITTIYTLLCAITRFSERNNYSGASTMANTYLMLSNNPTTGNKPKIEPTLKDVAQFNQIISELRSIENPSLLPNSGDGRRLRSMYLFHLREVEKRCIENGVYSESKLENLIHHVTRNLAFVLIQVPDEYDANRVFETLNERGISLSTADLVRNLIFSRSESNPATIEAIYNNHWIPLENQFNYEDKVKFAGYFYPFGLSFDPNVKKNSLYRILKDTWADLDPREMIEQLEIHTNTYRGLVFGVDSLQDDVFPNEDLRLRIDRLHRLGAPTSMYAFLFNVITHSQTQDDLTETLRCLDIVESILVRRSFLAIEPTGIHGLFKGLWQACGSTANSHRMQEILDAVEYFKFPEDSAFREAVVGKGTNFYARKMAMYICTEYEIYLHRENGGDRPSLEDITKEHIIPQSLENAHDYDISVEEHSEWVNSWPNIVLLQPEANSQIGNKNWSIKKPFYQNQSVFQSTRVMGQEESINVQVLEERGQMLSEFAVNRWPRHI